METPNKQYRGSATERIVKAIMGEPPVHPLHKSPCGFCAAMVCEKDMQDHLETLHADMADNGPYDEEPQSEREAYRLAHD
jgi:hypothetical protein